MATVKLLLFCAAALLGVAQAFERDEDDDATKHDRLFRHLMSEYVKDVLPAPTPKATVCLFGYILTITEVALT